MCCCIPLRRLSYLGTITHMIIGLFYLYYLGSVSYTLHKMKDEDNAKPRLVMGLFYMAYFAAFLPPGIFVFWGVHKKLRRFLVIPSISFMLIQIYGLGLECYFGFRPQWLPEAIKKFNSASDLKKLREGFWMDAALYVTTTIVYLFMLFFYYREIGPECGPVQSRYAQAYQQQQAQEAAAAAAASSHQLQHPHHQLPQTLSHLGLGAQPPVPFRPVNLGANPSHSHSLGSSQGGGGPCRNSTPCPPVPNQHPGSINLAALANLTYEQQQQLLKLQQHPILQHYQHQQHQRHHDPHDHIQHDQSVSVEHILLNQQFQSYAQILGNPKNPKF